MLPRAFVLVGLLAATAAAHADVFAFNATLDSGYSGSGSFTINTATGTLTDSDLSITDGTNDYEYGAGGPSMSSADEISLVFFSGSSPTLDATQLQILLPVASLVGYTGGAIYSASMPDPNGYYSGIILFDEETNAPIGDIGVEAGSLTNTTPITATPEPSSLALLGTGLLGAVGVVRRRVANRR